MTRGKKRLISTMIMALTLASTIACVTLSYKYGSEKLKHDEMLKDETSKYYEILKKDAQYYDVYKKNLTQLDKNYIAGKISYAEYSKTLNDITTTDMVVHDFSKIPQIKQKYLDEFSKIDEIKYKQSISILQTCISMGGTFISALGLTGGVAMITSTFDDKEDQLL